MWLDLANAYGSVPHKLIEFAVEFFYVLSGVQNIITRYLSNLHRHRHQATFKREASTIEELHGLCNKHPSDGSMHDQLLKRFDELLKSARMKSKAEKSRSLSIRKDPPHARTSEDVELSDWQIGKLTRQQHA